MEKTYKVSILRTRRILGHIQETMENKEMTIGEIAQERRKASDWIVSNFRWEDYPAKFSHLVYCYKIGEEFTIFPCGYLVDDETFYQNVASQQGAGLLFDRVWAYHKR